MFTWPTRGYSSISSCVVHPILDDSPAQLDHFLSNSLKPPPTSGASRNRNQIYKGTLTTCCWRTGAVNLKSVSSEHCKVEVASGSPPYKALFLWSLGKPRGGWRFWNGTRRHTEGIIRRGLEGQAMVKWTINHYMYMHLYTIIYDIIYIYLIIYNYVYRVYSFCKERHVSACLL